MRGDYLVRYGDLLQHGLKRLTTQGAWFRNGAYPYLATMTCVGHTTIGTGTLPYQHGMIANAWYDRATEKAVTCTADADALEVSYATSPGAGDSAKRMMVPTLAEVMREHAQVARRDDVDEGAVGDRRWPATRGDFVTWFGDRGAWETSSAFTTTPVPWFVGFLKGNPVDARRRQDLGARAAGRQATSSTTTCRANAGRRAGRRHFRIRSGAAGDTAYIDALAAVAVRRRLPRARWRKRRSTRCTSGPRTAPTFSA